MTGSGDPQRPRTKEIFFEASELPAEEQAAFLDELEGSDPEMAARVRQLLAAEDRAGDMFERPVHWPKPDPTSTLGFEDEFQPGAELGPYRLVKQIGRGGFGAVWLAEQTRPVRRQVALKVLQPGLDTREVIARFSAERQALALMDHPCIARVFDGGSTDRGRPFFAMEYVDGQRITAACEEAGLGLRGRLELFLEVCAAVQHAHQKGVIHRDLKPSNVLVHRVDGRLVPKVIDFGVAKALDADLTEATIHTRAGQIVGTPSYMSPEQLDGSRDVDTRADVYSLGVLLYELLVGAPPFDDQTIQNLDLLELMRHVREVEPQRPSTRSTGSTSSSIAPRLLRGDLDWIVMRCLEKDKERRYETVAQLAAEVRRHLAGERVLAGPPDWSYRLGKFARRHRVALGTTAVVFLSLVAATIVSYDQAQKATLASQNAHNEALRANGAEEQAKLEAVRANEAEESAREEARKAKRDLLRFEATATFLEDLLVSVDPAFARGRDTELLVAILTKAEDRLEAESAGLPEVEATLRRTLGGAFYGLTQWKRAERHLRLAYELRTEALGPTHADTLLSMQELAGVLVQDEQFEEAAALMEEALGPMRQLYGEDDPVVIDTLSNLAVAYGKLGLREKSIPHLSELESHLLETLGERHNDTIRVMNNLAGELEKVGRTEEALRRYRRALELQLELHDDSTPVVQKALNNLAFALLGEGEPEEALPLLERALAAKEGVLSAGHPSLLIGRNNLAQALGDLGRDTEAEDLYLLAIEEGLAERGPRDRTVLGLTFNYGAFLEQRERPEEAVELLEVAVDDARQALGELDLLTLRIESLLALGLLQVGRPVEAEPLARHSALHIGSTPLGNDPSPGLFRLRLAWVLRALERPGEARAVLEEALPLLEAVGTERWIDAARQELDHLR